MMKTSILLRTIYLCIGLLLWSSPTAAQRSDATKGNVKNASSAGLERGVAMYQSSRFKAAFEILEPIAEAGNPNAQTILGLMYDHGEGVPQDDAAAVSWYRKAADQGFAQAQFNLGAMYANGQGVPQDEAAAVSWYRKAADQGDVQAQFNLGVKYANGEFVPQDYAAAVSWYRKAADQGDAKAQSNLSIMYLMGKGVPQDLILAHKWMNLAAKNDNRQRWSRDALESLMTPAQIAEARKLAREWRKKEE